MVVNEFGWSNWPCHNRRSAQVLLQRTKSGGREILEQTLLVPLDEFIQGLLAKEFSVSYDSGDGLSDTWLSIKIASSSVRSPSTPNNGFLK